MKRTAAVLAAGLLLVLTGCSAAPSREEVAERYLLEYTDSEAIQDAMRESALSIADDALAGYCGDDDYEAGLLSGGDQSLFYAWRVTCSMYFEDDLSPQQVEETKQLVLDRGTEG
ncbi:hypothetical protein ACIP5T_17275 [Microbacterium sp. NPDC088619]|uniref:hypothetical protein n=1 Tax=Microbacterium sp. NPDC088619 TaxID=3364196 RepID=UPI00382F4BD9